MTEPNKATAPEPEVKKQDELMTEDELKTMIADQVRSAIGDGLKPVVDQVTGQTERIVQLEARQARLRGEPDVGKDLEETFLSEKYHPQSQLPKDEFSFVRCISGQITGKWDHAPFERQILQSEKAKALSLGTDSAGGYLVPTVDLPERFIERLDNQTVCVQAGCQVWDGLRGAPVNVPKEVNASTVYWVGENADITASDTSYGQVQLNPHGAAALLKMSRLLVENNAVAAEAFLRRRLAKDLALATDLALLRGTDTNNQPAGVINVSGINTYAMGTNGGVPEFSDAKAIQYELNTDNAPEEGRVWIMNSRTWNTFDTRLINSQTNRYALQASLRDGTPRRMLGHPVFVTNQIPNNLTKGSSNDCSQVFLGVIDTLILGRWGAMVIEASTQADTAFAYHQLWIKAIVHMDVGVTQPVAWCVCSDVRA